MAQATCTKCMNTLDKDGNPISYCTGMCNIIVLLNERIQKLLAR